MTSYLFKVVVEPDDDRWVAYAPALKKKGAASWGYTKEEALQTIHVVVQMVVEGLLEHGEPLPQDTPEDLQVFQDPRVLVTIRPAGRLRAAPRPVLRSGR